MGLLALVDVTGFNWSAGNQDSKRVAGSRLLPVAGSGLAVPLNRGFGLRAGVAVAVAGATGLVAAAAAARGGTWYMVVGKGE